MFNRKNKELADKELAAYKREKQLQIDEGILLRKANNWQSLDDTRQECNKKLIAVFVEAAKLEGELAGRRDAAIMVDKLKDRDISMLKDLLQTAITALQKQAEK